MAGGLALVTLAYYAFLHECGARRPLAGASRREPGARARADGGFVQTILANAILQEFVPFIVLLFSLYTISGGIRIAGDLQADPLTNAAFMAVGGRAGQLHRHDRRGDAADSPAAGNEPRAQARRPHGRDLHLHRLQLRRLPAADRRSAAVPWLSGRRAVSVDAVAVAGVAVRQRHAAGRPTCCIDRLCYYRRETIADIERDIEQVGRLQIRRLEAERAAAARRRAGRRAARSEQAVSRHRLASVDVPARAGAAGAWWRSRCGSATGRSARRISSTYGAIIEVAALFVGIFICMQPALQILGVRGDELGLDTPAAILLGVRHACRACSTTRRPISCSSRRPRRCRTPRAPCSKRASSTSILAAISLGAVFMGAMTYIGNGPNFMVKAIAESSGVKMPSFFGYMVYSFAILLPILALMVWLFLM